MAYEPFDDFVPGLDQDTRDLLGEDIEYSTNGGTSFNTIRALEVDYRDQQREIYGQQAIAQDIRVVVLVTDLTVEPAPSHQIRLKYRPGKVYRPVNPHFDESGTAYEFEVQTVVTA